MALMLALAIGIAFGFTLERAGLGSAPKLAGQFYFTDFTVMKVMFTAIVVAMTGAFWLGRIGALGGMAWSLVAIGCGSSGDDATPFSPDAAVCPGDASGSRRTSSSS